MSTEPSFPFSQHSLYKTSMQVIKFLYRRSLLAFGDGLSVLGSIAGDSVTRVARIEESGVASSG
jgi:hypothetical protein